MASPTDLDSFLSSHPSIKTYKPSHPEYSSVARTYLSTPAKPLIVVRPQTESDVSALVAHLRKHSEPFAIRSGGHDLASRSTVDGAVQIDLRDIAHVQVSPDRKSARIGGGILALDLLTALEKEGLTSAVGTVGTVGWVGWATLGGYGPYIGHFGLGCDQILGARVVLADGSVVDADETLLEGIRGAGPAFGAIVQVEIRVYPNIPEVQTGLVFYEDCPDPETVLSTWLGNLARLPEYPPELHVSPVVMELPGKGLVVCCSFFWGGPRTASYEAWLSRFAELAPGGTPHVQPITLVEHVKSVTAQIPPQVHGGRGGTASVRGLAPSLSAVAVTAKHAARIPRNSGVLFTAHLLHGAATRPLMPSVFRNREEHMVYDLISFVTDKSKGDEASAWSREFEAAIKDAEGYMEGAYFSLTEKERLDLQKVYGQAGVEKLRALKKAVDPGNVFRFPMPLSPSSA